MRLAQPSPSLNWLLARPMGEGEAQEVASRWLSRSDSRDVNKL